MNKVVIVDDEPMLCRWLTEKIDWQAWNCEIVGVGRNGLEGKELVKQHKPDILLTDVKMPGMNGLELSCYVLEHYPKTMVLILSGYNEFDFVRTAMRNEVFDYLLKPLDVEEFHKTMKKASSHLEQRLEHERKNEISEKRLEDSTELTESGILMKLFINGNKELPSLHTKIARLGFDLGKGQVVVYELHSPSDPLRDKWTPVYQYAVQNILFETFERLQCIPIVFHIGDRCVVVVKFQMGVATSLWEKRVLEAAKEGMENVKMYLNSRQSLGFGTVFKSIEEIYGSYQTAVEALEMQYFWLDETIPTMNGSVPMLIDAPFAVSPELYSIIENGDEDAASSSLASVTAQLRRIGKREFVYSVCTEMLIHLSKISEKWNKELDFLPLMNGMKQYRTFESLMKDLGHTVTSLCRWISSQKAYAVTSLPEKIVLYIQEHYHNPDINLGSIANEFHLSLSHLSRIFVRATGANFNEYVSQLRVEQAKKLMEQKHWLSNQDIAQRVGYNDGRYFSQVFKKYCGKTPNEYRGRRENKI
ncbi:response regulator [Paenibacillus frigoriresistens]|uniref:response regulator n=1 Tax=Paenibacillus alginolyticus TaxID=59839 RepID=UPI001563E418|nr:helix-turn-helix domain-containing protein [Paenibacillus frigoriresistens]NRF90366.1 response regulator [Paenibacillus frigoriresistens]